jgi:hypothetical protein
LTVSYEVVGDDSASAVRAAFALLDKYWERNGQNPRVGAKLESWLWQTGTFSEVNVHAVVAPVGNHPPPADAQHPAQVEGPPVDPKRGPLGLMFTITLRRTLAAETHPDLLALGYTPELKSKCVEQMRTSEWQMDTPLHFVWARKSVEAIKSRL